ncbi:hypothetical protein HUJ05_007015 [Dendroctonus ponderosae]|nr:hypothetical protein HUJ05_007015 [Dendroctonus ponderosae]
MVTLMPCNYLNAAQNSRCTMIDKMCEPKVKRARTDANDSTERDRTRQEALLCRTTIAGQTPRKHFLEKRVRKLVLLIDNGDVEEDGRSETLD